MMNIAVRFQEKTEKQEVPAGTRLKDLLQMGTHGARVIAARVDGRPVDLSVSVNGDCLIEWVEIDSPQGVDILRHSTSHLMAQAVKSLFPKAQVTIGPTIEEGFYYDFAYPGTFSPEDLQKIEEKMRSLIAANLTLERIEMPRARAITFFEEMGEGYKAEIIRGLEEEVVSLYRQGDFIDLCRGPHVPATGVIPAFKLLSVAGAYWRGDERNQMLQRIYGTAFPTQGALDQYLHKLEEIKRRDHRKIGKELDLFSIQEGIGAGLILWHPKGAMIRRLMEDFWKDEHLKSGYELLYTPHVAKIDLWHTSGHTAFYRENMYSPIRVDETDFQLKPMNCPFHIMVYQTHLRSYRDLPFRWAELGTVYRYERSGVLHGLMRVRGFTQDDAHIFCRPDQLHAEIVKILDLTVFVLKTFGFEKYDIFLSTRPEKYVGSLEDWDRATEALRSALEQKGLAYQEDPGEGVFYGPKIDIKIKDVLDRSWQCSTVQVDFNLPARFELSYAGEDGQMHRPIMVHRALMGSLERFFGVLIEHYAGAFPFWLAPVQVRVLPITDQQQVYAEEVRKTLMEEGFRVECDLRNEKLGYKIREAQLQKIPYMLVVGKKEVESHTVSVRKRSGEDLGGMEISRLIPVLREEMKTIKAEGGETVSKSN